MPREKIASDARCTTNPFITASPLHLTKHPFKVEEKAARAERRAHKKAEEKTSSVLEIGENDLAASNPASIHFQACVTTRPWTPLSSGNDLDNISFCYGNFLQEGKYSLEGGLIFYKILWQQRPVSLLQILLIEMAACFASCCH